jgi:hypothetical protein
VNHLERYVDGQVHTNGLENFWSLTKRALGGTYVAVEPFHLFRYLDEQMFSRCVTSSAAGTSTFMGSMGTLLIGGNRPGHGVSAAAVSLQVQTLICSSALSTQAPSLCLCPKALASLCLPRLVLCCWG